MPDLVRVKEKFQVTIPLAVRRRLAVNEGDYLEAIASDDGILLRPQRLVQATANRPSLLDFLAEPRAHTRSRQAIDAALAEDRGAWGER